MVKKKCEDLLGELFADVVLVNGKIVTLDAENTIAESVAIRDGKIVAVGDTKKIMRMKRESTKVIELRGRIVLPGLIESHVHPPDLGSKLTGVICTTPPNKSIADIISRIREKANQIPKGEWIRGFGYNEKKLKENRHPTRWDLDRATLDHPAYLFRTDFHMGVANSKALELANITRETLDPPGGKVVRNLDTGEPIGLLQEQAQNLIRDIVLSYTVEEIKEGIELANEQFLRWGFTTVHCAMTNRDEFRAYQELHREGKLKIRTCLLLDGRKPEDLHALIKVGPKSDFGNDKLKVIGIKFMCDGSMSGRTAALHETYENEPNNRGMLVVTQEELTEQVVKAHKAGLRPCIHAIGDRAVDVALNAIEAALKEKPAKDHRLRIEHCGLPTDQALRRIKKLGVVPISSIGFIYELGDTHLLGIGEERAKRYYPLKTYLEHGIVSTGNSDCPVCSGDPLQQIFCAVTRQTETGQTLGDTQGLSVMDAIRLYTINAAYAGFEEDIKGTIESGKLADFTILSRDILTIAPYEIKDTKAVTTIVGGEIAYQK
jgi:hypothetical protein